jgi:hypothetical protein
MVIRRPYWAPAGVFEVIECITRGVQLEIDIKPTKITMFHRR